MKNRSKNREKRSWRLLLVAPLLAAVSFGGLAAQEAEEGAWYARIRTLDPAVQVSNPVEDETFEATANTPLTVGDRVASDRTGRAEIQFEGGTIVRIDHDTRIDLQSLGSPETLPAGTVLLRLWQGSVQVDHRRLTGERVGFQIDAPVASVFLQTEGEFRFDLLPSGELRVSSYAGEAEVIGSTRSVIVGTGRQAVVPAYGDPLPAEPFNTARIDPFGEWVADRQEVFLGGEPPAGGEYPDVDDLPPEVEPYRGELDYYGGWQEVPVYGWVWRPYQIDASWRPYTYGYWRYYPTGWTWISYEPWGWYPYHYGRWHWVVGVGWSWIPGRVYSGAWVSWAYSSSYIGWCPLNYYNQPAFVGLHFSTYDERGWNFVSYSRFNHRDSNRYRVRPVDVERTERIHRVTGNPRFRPGDLGSPDLGPRLSREARLGNRARPAVAGGRLRSFRFDDRREDPPARRRRTAIPGRGRGRSGGGENGVGRPPASGPRDNPGRSNPGRGYRPSEGRPADVRSRPDRGARTTPGRTDHGGRVARPNAPAGRNRPTAARDRTTGRSRFLEVLDRRKRPGTAPGVKRPTSSSDRGGHSARRGGSAGRKGGKSIGSRRPTTRRAPDRSHAPRRSSPPPKRNNNRSKSDRGSKK